MTVFSPAMASAALDPSSVAKCGNDFLEQCRGCFHCTESIVGDEPLNYTCDLPGLTGFVPGEYEGVEVNFLSFVTNISAPSFPIRAKEFEACTGGRIVFSEAENIWEDPVQDLGTKRSRGTLR